MALRNTIELKSLFWNTELTQLFFNKLLLFGFAEHKSAPSAETRPHYFASPDEMFVSDCYEDFAEVCSGLAWCNTRAQGQIAPTFCTDLSALHTFPSSQWIYLKMPMNNWMNWLLGAEFLQLCGVCWIPAWGGGEQSIHDPPPLMHGGCEAGSCFPWNAVLSFTEHDLSPGVQTIPFSLTCPEKVIPEVLVLVYLLGLQSCFLMVCLESLPLPQKNLVFESFGYITDFPSNLISVCSHK